VKRRAKEADSFRERIAVFESERAVEKRE
jgi:hypothetical protein